MNIITALGNPKINNELKKTHNVICQDIQYKEAIIEILNKHKEVNLIIISNALPGEISLYELIGNIKVNNNNIKIMMILEKEDEKTISFLWSQNIYDIFYNNKTLIKEIIEKINNNNLEKIKKENKKILFDKKVISNLIKKIIISINYKKTIESSNNKIIVIMGSAGVGKSIFISIISKMTNKNVLIYDFKKNVKTILGLKENNKKIAINSNINLLFERDSQEESKNDLIIFEDKEELKFDFKKEILKKANKIIVLIEPNLLEIKKSKELLDKYISDFQIPKNKIKIIFNKVTIFSINDFILRQIFSEFQIIGKLKLNSKYNLLINSNLKYMSKEIREEYKKITRKIGGCK